MYVVVANVEGASLWLPIVISEICDTLENIVSKKNSNTVVMTFIATDPWRQETESAMAKDDSP